MRKSYIFNRKAALLTLLLCLCMLQVKPLKAASSGNTWSDNGWTYTYNLDDNDNATITKVVPTGYEDDVTGWIASLTAEQQESANNGKGFIDFTFPTEIDGKKVVEIKGTDGGSATNSASVFAGLMIYIRSVTIPSGVTTLGNYAFYSTRNVKNNIVSISLPDGLETIGNYALNLGRSGSESPILSELSIPSSVKSLGKYSIAIGSLTKIDFGTDSKLQSLSQYSFSACTQLKTLKIPASVTTLGGAIISNCPNLQCIVLDGDGISGDDLKNKSFPSSSYKGSVYFPLRYVTKYTNVTLKSKNAKMRFYAESRIVKVSSRYGTICLPYTISASECANIKAFYEEKSENAVNDDHTYITFNQVTTLEAGKPYIFEQKGTTADDGTFTAADASGLVVFAIADAEETPVTAEVNTGAYFKGTFDGKSYDDLKGGSNYILQSDGVFRKVGATSVKVGTYRAYLDLSSLLNGAKSNKISINFKNSETTGIDGLKKNESRVNKGWMYNLHGQRITAPAHGQLYIKNGKKYIKN